MKTSTSCQPDACEEDHHRNPAPFIPGGFGLLRLGDEFVHAANDRVRLVGDGDIDRRVFLFAELVRILVSLFTRGVEQIKEEYENDDASDRAYAKKSFHPCLRL